MADPSESSRPATPLSQKPTVALVGPARPFRGGIAHFQARLARELQVAACRVEEISFSRLYPKLLFPGKTQFEPDAAPDASSRLIDSINPFSWSRAAAHLSGLKPDTVVFQHWLPFFAPAYARIARTANHDGASTVAVVHNAIPHEHRIGDRALSRLFLQRCGLLIALSNTVADDLSRLGIDRPTRVVAHPVYDDLGNPVPRAEARAKLGLEGDAPTILFFGFVRKYKGLDILLNAMARIRDELPDIRLIIAGEFYEDESSYRRRIDDEGLEDATIVENRYVPAEEIPLYFGAADVVVQPYRSATQSGIAAIAHHFERPVIVSDVGSLAEEVTDGKTGFVVPPNDPAAISTAVLRFFKSDTDWAAEIRSRSRGGDWKALAEIILSTVRAST